MNRRVLGFGFLAVAFWLLVVGAIDVLGRIDEDEALAYGVAIFVATVIGAGLSGKARE